MPTPGSPPQRSRTRWIAAAVAAVLLVAVGAALSYALTRGHGHHPPAAVPTGSPTPTSAATTSPTSTDFSALYAQVNSGVVRIETVSCDHDGVGSGFLLSPTLVATVDHVTNQSAVISLIAGNQHATGTVIGADPARDLALVRADHPLSGYHFRLSATEPTIGSRVAAIGFPVGDPITLNQGGISGLNRTININGTFRNGLIETDAAINPGNSGGPLLAADGNVVGLVVAKNTEASGIAYAVPSTQASGEFAQWRANPNPQPPADCQNAAGPGQQATPSLPAPAPGTLDPADAQAIETTLETYFTGINTAEYASAYAMFSPAKQASLSFSDFASGDATSFDSNIHILDVRQLDPDHVKVALSFTSLQAADHGPNGDTCDNWTLEYTMARQPGGQWLIDDVNAYNGAPEHTPC